jgi:hypothetical protein
MEIRGVPFEQVTRITEKVSAQSYGGNVIVHRDARDLATRNGGFAGRITVADSSGPGARRSWSGRRMPAACWHAFRDVLAEIFEQYPDARARTAMANYIGRDGFHATYPQTADKNIGSQVRPAYMPDLCDCEH